MKKIFLALGVAAAALASCKDETDFLEPSTSAVDAATVFGDSTRTLAFLTRIYGDVGFSFSKDRFGSRGNIEQATDDAEYTQIGSGNPSVQLYSGTYSPIALPSNDFWQVPWDNIRRVNLLLYKLPTTPLTASTQAKVAAQARFLRVWYYHQLLTSFGGVPLVGDRVFGTTDGVDLTTDDIDLPRDNYAACVAYLVSELDDLAQKLPAQQLAVDYGRATSDMCLALKSRLLLYAASPLFNGGALTTDPSLAALVSYPTYNASNWQAAADAAQAVINLNRYTLVVDNTTAPGYGFVATFLQRLSPEYIMPVNRPSNKDFEPAFLPVSRGGGNLQTMPTQEIVDAFPMKNGKAITDPTSGYNPNAPYVNREPRFYNSIIHNQANFMLASANAQRPVNTYVGAPSDFIEGTSTGYYFRKMLDPNIAGNSGANPNRSWPIIRYAEILLNYAEAINETGQPELAVDKLKLLRARAGIEAGADGRYGIASGVSVSALRTIIQNERRIELLLEDHRWHDIRRWKIAKTVNNSVPGRVVPTRMRITASTTTPVTYTYTRVPTNRAHYFRDEMYLLPIPDIEIRRVPQFRQNPGW